MSTEHWLFIYYTIAEHRFGDTFKTACILCDALQRQENITAVCLHHPNACAGRITMLEMMGPLCFDKVSVVDQSLEKLRQTLARNPGMNVWSDTVLHKEYFVRPTSL